MIKLGSMSGQPLRQVASSCAEEIEQQNHADRVLCYSEQWPLKTSSDDE